MPKPIIFPCGGPGQEPCPPVPAVVTAADIVEAFEALAPAELVEGYQEWHRRQKAEDSK